MVRRLGEAATTRVDLTTYGDAAAVPTKDDPRWLGAASRRRSLSGDLRWLSGGPWQACARPCDKTRARESGFLKSASTMSSFAALGPGFGITR